MGHSTTDTVTDAVNRVRDAAPSVDDVIHRVRDATPDIDVAAGAEAIRKAASNRNQVLLALMVVAAALGALLWKRRQS